jgi:hypothetical protein
MKKLITILTLTVVGVSVAFAQGKISFRNQASAFTDSATVDRFVYFGMVTTPADTQRLVVGTNYIAQLYYGIGQGLAEGALDLRAAPAPFRVTTTASRGSWNGADRTLPGTAPGTGQHITAQVRVWDILAGPDYDSAVGGLRGTSVPFDYIVPDNGTTDLTQFAMSGLRAFALVPEPSTIALGLVGGIGALLLFRRRK